MLERFNLYLLSAHQSHRQQIQGGQQIEDQPNLLSSLNLLKDQAPSHSLFHFMHKPAGNSAVAGVVS